MRRKILITGGAGFIGSHLAEELLERGYEVRILDNLSPQVHGMSDAPPDYLSPEVEFVRGDVRDRDALRRAVQGVQAVYHLAAAVGVGQSMYAIENYTSVNNVGTALLLEVLLDQPVERLIVASSMSIYGEGLYRTASGGLVEDAERSVEQLRRGEWELREEDGGVLEPLPTPETKCPSLASVYALSKYDQERLCLMIGRTYGIEAVALRFFNVFGTRQALSNPYTGVLAIFASRILNGNPPLIFEDGRQQRDFVHVTDVARALRMALETPNAAGGVFNIGSGRARTVLEIAERMLRVLDGKGIEPVINGKYRAGDIRHCFADIALARRVLGYEPKVDFDEGLSELVEWLRTQAADDHVESAYDELAQRGLAL